MLTPCIGASRPTMGLPTLNGWVLSGSLAARRLRRTGVSGWAWFELEKMSGASRAERDALRLMALLLGHWDNKMENQRLVCLDESAPSPAGECRRPFALIQDLGATFGPRKIDLARWRATPIWRDAERCVVSMRDMPWGGGTFTDVQLTEGGRQLIAQQLSGVTHTQLTRLFEGARFGEFERGRWFGPAAPVSAWVTAFEEKVRQIRDAGPCPSKATTAKIAED